MMSTEQCWVAAVTSGAVSRMTLRACTRAEAKRRSRSWLSMSARAQKTFWGPSSRDSLRSMREPLRCSRRPPSGPLNLCKHTRPVLPLCGFCLWSIVSAGCKFGLLSVEAERGAKGRMPPTYVNLTDVFPDCIWKQSSTQLVSECWYRHAWALKHVPGCTQTSPNLQ